MTVLAVGSVGALIGLHLVPFRVILCLPLWAAVLYHSQFCCDLVNIIAKIVGDYDLKPLEQYIQVKLKKYVTQI